MAPRLVSIALSSGFLPDPLVLSFVPRASPDGAQRLETCVAQVSAEPDLEVIYTEGGLPFGLRATGDGQITVFVKTPDGQLECEQGDGGATVSFATPISGTYNVWVIGSPAITTLSISEVEYFDENGIAVGSMAFPATPADQDDPAPADLPTCPGDPRCEEPETLSTSRRP